MRAGENRTVRSRVYGSPDYLINSEACELRVVPRFLEISALKPLNVQIRRVRMAHGPRPIGDPHALCPCVRIRGRTVSTICAFAKWVSSPRRDLQPKTDGDSSARIIPLLLGFVE